jgi:hypothetical protein
MALRKQLTSASACAVIEIDINNIGQDLRLRASRSRSACYR